MKPRPNWIKALNAVPRQGIDADEQTGTPLAPAERSRRVKELFEAHNNALLKFLTSRLKSVQEAKEVAQEAYVRLLQIDSDRGISHLEAFLFRTAANLASNRIKSAARRERIDSIVFFGEAQVAPAAETEVAAQQEIEALLGAIEELPAKCRNAFVMYRFYCHELADIARSMNISERMVRIYIERAAAFCYERLLSTGGET